MFPLQCTVRSCTRLLRREENRLVCDAGHSFDRAKSGYWSLLQPQDRKSLKPGDSDDAVDARHRWLENGHCDGLVAALRPWVELQMERPTIMDLGCGEGFFGASLFADRPDGYCGIDLSKRAMKLAARRLPEATWVIANADRGLPAPDQSVDGVLSLFGRRPGQEIQRVLKPTGQCIIAIPAADDLIELREEVQQSGQRRSRWEAVVDQLQHDGLSLVEHRKWSESQLLAQEEIQAAMAMTYRGVRHSQRARLLAVSEMTVTLAADLLLMRRT